MRYVSLVAFFGLDGGAQELHNSLVIAARIFNHCELSVGLGMTSSQEMPQTLLKSCPFEQEQLDHPAKGQKGPYPEQNKGQALNWLQADSDPNFLTQSSLLPIMPIFLLDMYSMVEIRVHNLSQVTSSSLARATSNHSVPTQQFSSVATQYEAVTSGEKQKMRSTREMLKCGISLRSSSSSKSTEEMKNLKVSVLYNWPTMKNSSSLPSPLRQSKCVQLTFLGWNCMLAMEHCASVRQRAIITRTSVFIIRSSYKYYHAIATIQSLTLPHFVSLSHKLTYGHSCSTDYYPSSFYDYFIEDYYMRRQPSHPYKNGDLTLSFGDFVNPRGATIANPFQRVKSEMLKRRQRLAIRKKPLQYQKLQLSLQEKLKQKSFNAEQQRDQLIMLEKCKSYFQLRRKKSGILTYDTLTPKNSIHQAKKRPQTSNVSVRNSTFMDKLKNVMKECTVEDKQECEMKENMGLFTFYCKMMDKRLEGIKNNIEKKERMV